ncbi:type I restriction endonuclease subunit R [Candidatus Venteria ishoeyi]|uniref:Type I restriction enzyme endonuclease subunit n=1 Tax=Candidatus Venteria ishoeyi TaxID=1899563 RepID=A0A1H6F7D9_9GAMM|nr:HsdR family type I site-specific deoxyribonuclease [Candidatus Venteria ishoeyi]SEH04986.1 Type-1 restriction enzyme R protein [Candidatus Venteria ishoeyi]
MTFAKENEFEYALINELKNKGWESEVLQYPSEEDLLKNWAEILFENNRGIDRLNDEPLTDTEMAQILEQIRELKTPLKLNGFINGKTVAITRDNPADRLHLGKEISLKIYDRQEIAAGQSRYQIVQQPRFKSASKILNDRRGDLMLLINGMPVIHIELKKSGVAVAQACHQIEKYAAEGIFSGLFSLIQVFVAMEPQNMRYFANPGADGQFNKDFYFHWADVNNEPINDWKIIASRLLSIPMAHQLIGFYTVADGSDGVLKVMRSYQYYAANALSDKVTKTDWQDKNLLGGYIWHTTGSGKTMTSFKSAQLIANSKDADKVIFLMDRIELGTQSLQEYRGFAGENEEVQATENTGVLITKLKSTDHANTLIVSSIQKMSNINTEEGGLVSHDIELMCAKRIVFIIDEAHRSTFGDMLMIIKNTFPSALFFGFTGTPIQVENQKKMNTTATVFGNELHRYSIADGIRDKNVLGFDPYRVMTYKDRDLRKAVALEKAKATTESEAFSDPRKKKIFNRFMQQVTMAGYIDDAGKYVKGIEDELPTSQYTRDAHQQKVVEDIIDNWVDLSQNYKFHAIFATSSIPEAIAYYRLLKKQHAALKITALFDPNIDNGGGIAFKQDGLVEIIEDYNQNYGQDFTLANHGRFKKDIAARLGHKAPYTRIESTSDKQIDLLIVVDQMLTGFDSKWLNTLYMDKVLKYESIIQAFSRTNRLFGPDKPFGTIRYYRLPHSMTRNIDAAVKLYSGDKAVGLFVDRLESNLKKLNALYDDIVELFDNAEVDHFEQLPDELSERGQFAKLFKDFNAYLEAAKIQGFKWSQSSYLFAKDKEKTEIALHFDEKTYLILALRYKELSKREDDGGGIADVPFEIDGHLTEIDTGVIDAEYMNTRFDKYLKTLQQDHVDAEKIQKSLDELHKSFASLSQEEQKYANIFLHDVQRGDVMLDHKKTFRAHITDYQSQAKNSEIADIAQKLGLDKVKLNNMMNTGITELNINEYGRFDELKSGVDKEKAKAYFEKLEGKAVSAFHVNIKVHKLLQDFIIRGGFALKNDN